MQGRDQRRLIDVGLDDDAMGQLGQGHRDHALDAVPRQAGQPGPRAGAFLLRQLGLIDDVGEQRACEGVVAARGSSTG